MRTVAVLSFLLVLLLSVNGYATLLDIPAPWRGDPDSTLQAWEFSTPDNPAILAPGWDNPNGTPVATIVDATGLGMTYHMPSYDAGGSEIEYGIWKVYAGMIVLDIPNTTNTAPDTWKDIWLQITYIDPDGSGGNIPFGVEPPYTSLTLEERIVLDLMLY